MENFHSRKPYYMNDSDYNTNAPSYYDDLARKQELIKKLANRIWEYDETLSKKLKEIEGILEEVLYVIGKGFNEEINDLLVEWVNNGTLNKIINEEIFNELNDKVENVIENLDVFKSEISENISTLENNLKNIKEQLSNRISIIENDTFNLGKTIFIRGYN